MYEIETATNEHQNHDDSGSANIFQMSPLIHKIVNSPIKWLINSHICNITKIYNLTIDKRGKSIRLVLKTEINTLSYTQVNLQRVLNIFWIYIEHFLKHMLNILWKIHMFNICYSEHMLNIRCNSTCVQYTQLTYYWKTR